MILSSDKLVETPNDANELYGYHPKLPFYDHQVEALKRGCEKKNYAFLLEMGLGKTAIIISNAGILHLAGKMTGVLVLSPKGVHRQWLDEQLPIHLDESITVNKLIWKQKIIDKKEMNSKGLTFFSMNIDAIRTPKGYKCAQDFLLLHNGKSMMVIDESHTVKSFSADRTKAAIRLGQYATYRRIATGTPISKSIIDTFSQFLFLDVSILGHRHMTTFRSRYCIMGGWEGKQIVGQRNVDEFNSLIANYSYRLTKEEALNLPPKIYVKREYEMGERTNQHYQSLRKTFMTELDNGNIIDVQNAAVALLRLQQVICGYLPLIGDDGKVNSMETFSNERLDVLMDIIDQVNGPVIIWARFIHDLKRIKEMLDTEFGPEKSVLYYGATSTTEREIAKQKFLNGKARFFVSNPAAGGLGLNLQGECQTAIYYSNSFDALHRWQSEDRIHRMGMKGAVTYFDIVAGRSIDRAILSNLKAKKSLLILTFDQLRKVIADA